MLFYVAHGSSYNKIFFFLEGVGRSYYSVIYFCQILSNQSRNKRFILLGDGQQVFMVAYINFINYNV